VIASTVLKIKKNLLFFNTKKQQKTKKQTNKQNKQKIEL